jgi:hypothetical protein
MCSTDIIELLLGGSCPHPSAQKETGKQYGKMDQLPEMAQNLSFLANLRRNLTQAFAKNLILSFSQMVSHHHLIPQGSTATVNSLRS